MKKIILGLFLLAISFAGFSQSKGFLFYDTTVVTKKGGSNTLVIENNTRDTLGALFNIGKGVTIFKRIMNKVNDSVYVFGFDTLKLANLGGANATNGLSKISGNIGLGGTLTQSTTINGGAYSKALTLSAISNLNFDATNISETYQGNYQVGYLGGLGSTLLMNQRSLSLKGNDSVYITGTTGKFSIKSPLIYLDSFHNNITNDSALIVDQFGKVGLKTLYNYLGSTNIRITGPSIYLKDTIVITGGMTLLAPVNGDSSNRVPTTAWVKANIPGSSGGGSYSPGYGILIPSGVIKVDTSLIVYKTFITAALLDKVSISGSYSNPSWISTLAWSKITSTPTTVAGYGITDVYTKTASDARYLQTVDTFNISSFSVKVRSLFGASGASTFNAATGVVNTPLTLSSYTNDPGFYKPSDTTATLATKTNISGKEDKANKGVANGYAGLGAGGLVPPSQLGTGTANSTTFLTGAGTYVTPSGVVSNLGSVFTADKITITNSNGTGVILDSATTSNAGMLPAFYKRLLDSLRYRLIANNPGTVTTLTATNNTGQTWTITNATSTPNISLALTSAAVGLGSVNNTSDAAKPVSTLQAAAIALKVNISDTAAMLATYLKSNIAAATYVSLSGSYTNPSWIVSLPYSKITGTPTSLAGYGITDPIVLTTGTYSNPAWITSLAWSKITGTPTTISGYGITDGVTLSGTQTLTNKSIDASQLTGSIATGRYATTTIPTTAINATGGAAGKVLTWDGVWVTPSGATYTPGIGLILSGSQFKLDTAWVTANYLPNHPTKIIFGSPALYGINDSTIAFNPDSSFLVKKDSIGGGNLYNYINKAWYLVGSVGGGSGGLDSVSIYTTDFFFKQTTGTYANPLKLDTTFGHMVTYRIADSIATVHTPTATTSILGLVKPDGTTIGISGGVLSVIGGGSADYVTATAVNTANYTTTTATFVTLPDLTGQANRTVTLPASPTTGRNYVYRNTNSSGFAWSFSGGTVKDNLNNTITTLLNQEVYHLVYDGTNYLIIN